MIGLGCGGQSRPPAGALADVPRTTIDDLSELDGTALGTPISEIANLADPPGPLASGLRKKEPPSSVLGHTPVETVYGFENEKLESAIFSLEPSACPEIVSTLETRLGPASKDGPRSEWIGNAHQLKVGMLGDTCVVTFGIVAAYRSDDTCNGPKSPAEARFLGAPIGADASVVKGFRQKDTHDGDVWYEPPNKTYDGISLAALTYKIHEGRLENIGFDAKGDGPCKALAEKLHATYGESSSEPNLGGGTSYKWQGEGFLLIFNDYRGKCAGIFSAATCQWR
jgi:hypothetical protein